MYWSEIQMCLRPGRSTPAIRAISYSCSTLALLVARILADHPNHTFAVDDLALVANLLDARTDFHDSPLTELCRDSSTARVERTDFQSNPVAGDDLDGHSLCHRAQGRDQLATI